MRAYLTSPERLRNRDEQIIQPGHGQPITSPQRYLRAVLHHRNARAGAILRRLNASNRSIEAIVENIYSDINPNLLHAAAMTVLAHLQDLVERKLAACEGAVTPQTRYFLIKLEMINFLAHLLGLR